MLELSSMAIAGMNKFAAERKREMPLTALVAAATASSLRAAAGMTAFRRACSAVDAPTITTSIPRPAHTLTASTGQLRIVDAIDVVDKDGGQSSSDSEVPAT